jgi:hypothetical protein
METEGISHFTKREIKRNLKYQIIVFRRHSFLSNNFYFGDIFNYPMRGLDKLYYFIITENQSITLYNL